VGRGGQLDLMRCCACSRSCPALWSSPVRRATACGYARASAFGSLAHNARPVSVEPEVDAHGIAIHDGRLIIPAYPCPARLLPLPLGIHHKRFISKAWSFNTYTPVSQPLRYILALRTCATGDTRRAQTCTRTCVSPLLAMLVAPPTKHL
jgi:hypothetical protein